MGRCKKKKWRNKSQRHQPVTVEFDVNSVDPSLLEKAQNLFQKVFSYPQQQQENVSEKIENSELLEKLFRTPRWDIPKLQKLKQDLNDTKTQLSGLDIILWHTHTGKTHAGSMVKNHIQRSYGAELCTQAWCKFREILSRFEIVSQDCDFASVHLCEAPGGFVACLNQYLTNNGFAREWQWLALSLNPYHEGNLLGPMIGVDTFIFETLDNWSFGEDDTGDVMNKKNIEHLCRTVADTTGVTLVTADGSIDCANTPGEQEQLTSELHYAEVVTALRILQPGGDFVLKMFTLFEDMSVGLVYLLTQVFVQVNVFKPVTSKPGNSEVYVVCKDYQGTPWPLLDKLTENVGADNSEVSFWPREKIPDDFLESHYNCCERFSGYQRDTILENLRLFTSADRITELAAVEKLQRLVLEQYTSGYNLQPIEEEERIVPLYHKDRGTKKCHYARFGQKNQHCGSFNDRQKLLHLVWEERIKRMEPLKENPVPRLWLKPHMTVGGEEMSSWKSVTGQKFSSVLSSKFCDNKLLSMYRDVLDNMKSLSQINTVEAYTAFTQQESQQIAFALPGPCTVLPLVNNKGDNLTSALRERIGQECDQACDSADMRPKVLVCEVYDPSLSEDCWLTSCDVVVSILTLLQHQDLRSQDVLVVTLPPILTRMMAGLVFILGQSFSKVTLLGAGASFPLCTLLASSCRPLSSELLSHLSAVLQDLAQPDSPDTSSVLSFVPIQYLLEPSLHGLLWKMNHAFLCQRINFLMEKEKLHLEIS